MQDNLAHYYSMVMSHLSIYQSIYLSLFTKPLKYFCFGQYPSSNSKPYLQSFITRLY